MAEHHAKHAEEEGLEAMTAPTQASSVRRPAVARFWAAVVLLACSALLGLAGYFKPDPRGFGTHEQLLGMGGPCGMRTTTGFPCPTCGMTTAFAHTVRGQWLRAFLVQPAGFVLAVGTIGLAGVSLSTLFRGRWPRVNLWVITPYRFFLGLLVLFLGAWAFKVIVGLADGTLPCR